MQPKQRKGEATRPGLPSQTPGPRNAASSANPFLWPFFAAAAASHASASLFQGFAATFVRNDGDGECPQPQWTTSSKVVLELSTMRLRDFSAQPGGQATLVCAPYALHGADIADFA